MDRSVRLSAYREKKQRLIQLVLWRVVQLVFPALPHCIRICVLRAMGARIGRRCLIYRNVRIYCPWNLHLGDYVCIGPRSEIYDKDIVSVGDNVVISQDAYICTAGHDPHSPIMAPKNAPIVIGSNVWIAAKASVLPGVSIGEGSVVGACSVVSRDIPSWKIVVGNPAKIVKDRLLI